MRLAARLADCCMQLAADLLLRTCCATRYLSDPHARVHRVFTGGEHSYQRWQRDWPRDQCVTVAQVRTGHSPLVAAYLHRIKRRDSAICPHCHSADETVEHLVFQCPAHDHARRDTWPGDTFTTDPRRLWNYLERTGAVPAPSPPTGNEKERERAIPPKNQQYEPFYLQTVSAW